MSDRLMLLDTASLYFRAFHGVPDSLTRSDGTPVNAVRGLLDMIAKLVTDFSPSKLVACWDDDWRPAWRVALIPGYKAHRVERVVSNGADVEVVPDGLVRQIPLIREVLDLLEIPIVGAAEHEADDVIGTLATDAALPVDIVTGDRDLFQLVDDASDVRVIYTAKGMRNLEIVTDVVVVQKYAVLPQQYADFAVMRGDTSDGLPGVAGVGDKTASGLLQTFGDLDGIRDAAASGAEGMSAGVRAKLVTASDYLDVAPKVVKVATDLELAGFDATLRPVTGARRERLAALADEWNLGGSVARAIAALD